MHGFSFFDSLYQILVIGIMILIIILIINFTLYQKRKRETFEKQLESIEKKLDMMIERMKKDS
ncbi:MULTISPECIES: DUF4083 family protein [Bacillaceae]|jgi:hypothetical protein|uniref:DUF4083 family protein n=2 Tax=Bacillaceae TaxID=186817 RepID=A0ABU9JYB8_9BACI|nr:MULTISPECIES: DUF4083 family protein [Bacillaceae]MCB5936907.1 DUF4083 family protein [Bacillus sp. DFI.2.34]NWN98523.1 DUF4083 family protein [Bacillus sp. (in: firmicutes)]AWI12368.1 DUF4083 domain-containing protein [Caldibacillus thermoamylovorans]KIO58761.1 hypothetical protein B4065_0581 [Caldibacillus thermoamylovorans]KIO67868.1 hypothetical protein B4064_1949 [Caldibacillus thermoamylovorans]